MSKPNSNGSGSTHPCRIPLPAKTQPAGALCAPCHAAARHAGCRGGHPAGLTLTELLVVVLIIIVLAALIFPLVTNLRESALTAKCASNMRQSAIACMAFAAENNGRLPRLRVPNAMAIQELRLDPRDVDQKIVNNKPVYFWPDMVSKYEDGFDYFSCPKLKHPATDPPGGALSNRVPLGIGINIPYMAPLDGDAAANQPFSWVRLAQVTEPNRIVWFTDAAGSDTGEWNERVDLPGQGSLWFRGNNSQSVMPRHKGKINVCFADGHVALVDPRDINWGDRDSSRSYVGYCQF